MFAKTETQIAESLCIFLIYIQKREINWVAIIEHYAQFVFLFPYAGWISYLTSCLCLLSLSLCGADELIIAGVDFFLYPLYLSPEGVSVWPVADHIKHHKASGCFWPFSLWFSKPFGLKLLFLCLSWTQWLSFICISLLDVVWFIWFKVIILYAFDCVIAVFVCFPPTYISFKPQWEIIRWRKYMCLIKWGTLELIPFKHKYIYIYFFFFFFSNVFN